MKKYLKKVVAIILTISTLLTLCSCGTIGKIKVDAKEYIEIECNGLNGYATASLNVDYDGLNAVVAENLQKFVSKMSDKQSDFLLLGLSDIRSYIVFDFKEEYSNLSNGDTVTVTISAQDEILNYLGWDFDDVEKELGIKFVDTEISFKVEGLQDGTYINLFDGFEEYINYDGWVYETKIIVDGEATPVICLPEDFEKQVDDLYFVRARWSSYTLKVIRNNEHIADIEYCIDSSAKNLSSGDEFKITIRTSSKLAEMNYVYDESKTFTVPTLSTRISSMEQLSAKDIQQIKNDIATQCNEEEAKVLEVKYLYFGTRKPTSTSMYANTILAAVNVEDGLFGSRGIYVWVDVARTPEGKLVVDAYSYQTAYEGIEEKINNDKSYTFKSLL